MVTYVQVCSQYNASGTPGLPLTDAHLFHKTCHALLLMGLVISAEIHICLVSDPSSYTMISLTVMFYMERATLLNTDFVCICRAIYLLSFCLQHTMQSFIVTFCITLYYYCLVRAVPVISFMMFPFALLHYLLLPAE